MCITSIATLQIVMSAGQQTWASQKAPIAIDCPCNKNPGSLTGSTIVDETANNFERKLAKLATEKCWLDPAHQVWLAQFELVDLRQGRTLCQAHTANNANKGLGYKKP